MTFDEIKQYILNSYAQNRADAGLPVDDPADWSIFSIKGMFVYVSTAISYLLQSLFTQMQADVDDALKNRKAPTKGWIANLVLNFQYGFPLITDTSDFDNTGYTQAQIDASKVIKYVAVIRQINDYGRVLLNIKVAGSNGDDLQQTSDTVATALTSYLEIAMPAGDNWIVQNKNYDKLKNAWTIYYDPLILDANGSRLDGTDTAPVKTAIKTFLKDVSDGGNMPFSGTYVLQYHEDFVQSVPGVVIAKLASASTSYGDLPFTKVNVEYDPDSGWLRFDQDTDLKITYIAHQSFR